MKTWLLLNLLLGLIWLYWAGYRAGESATWKTVQDLEKQYPFPFTAFTPQEPPG